ncbi:MAG: chemotaxis protein CheA [Pyrinomonadaceae bacterium]
MDAPLSLDFLAQAEELIDSLFADVRDLRGALAGRERRALVDQTFRHAHTLKGSAATVPRLADASRLAHELENLLEAARSGRLSTDDEMLDACEDATDLLSRLVEAAARGEEAPPVAQVVERLRQLVARPDAVRATAGDSHADASQPGVLAALPAEIAGLLNARERLRLAEAIKEGARTLIVEGDFDLADFDEKFAGLTDALGKSAEVVATLPGAANADPSRINLRLLCATDASPDDTARTLAPFDARVVMLAAETETQSRGSALAETAEADVGAEMESAAASAKEAGEVASDDDPHGARGEHDEVDMQSAAGVNAATVRVPLEELDELVFAANELFDDAVRMLGVARASSNADGVARLEEIAPRLHENFHALVERVMALRMRTLARTLERAARAARFAARKSGKRIEIEIEGGAARVERSAAERLAEPLAHLLRNAVDHGVESPRERRAAGKPARGLVRIAARVEGSRVHVSVADDGRGIDPSRIERAARARGVIEEGARVSEAQALRLIFRPGFSTAEHVSMSSGRGVGLDAVEHEIEQAGGEVRVRTRAGEGTTFELNLPLALALVPALLVEARGFPYALDASRVVAVVSPADAEVADAEASVVGAAKGRTVRWRDTRLPLFDLGGLLAGAAGRGSADELSNVIVVRAGDARDDEEGSDGVPGGDAREDKKPSPRLVALSVGRALGRREALVRSLGRHATRWRGVSGAIDLRDGTVALMLDLPRLLEG